MLRWPLGWILHCTLSFFGACSISRNRFLLFLNLLLRTFGLPQVSFSYFKSICLLFKLFIENRLNGSFCSNFFLGTVLMVLQSLVKSLMVSSRFDIIQESRVESQLASIIELIV
jgi:hypothetical protein